VSSQTGNDVSLFKARTFWCLCTTEDIPSCMVSSWPLGTGGPRPVEVLRNHFRIHPTAWICLKRTRRPWLV